MSRDAETIRGVDDYLEAHRGDFEEQLKALLRVPSVSAQPSTTPTRDGRRR